jgi:hypothetical protein
VEAVHPDDFLCDLLDLDHRTVVAALRSQASELRKPPHTLDDVLRKLGARGVPRFAEAVRAIVAGRPE